MTDTEQPQPAGRAWFRYDPDEDTGEISLPGSVDAVPSVLSPGDTFSVADRHAEQFRTESAARRFVEIDEPAKPSPNEQLTREQLAEKLGDSSLATEPKPDLVELADEHDRTHPQPIGADETAGEYVPPFDAAVAEQQQAEADAVDGEDTGEGDEQ